MILIITIATIGLCVSIYSYWIERKIKNEPTYKPACDLSDHVSCSKPMLSPYANIFYFSTAFTGTAYYALVLLLAYFNMVPLLLIAAIGACITSIILAYILYVKIQSLCILCTTLYIINFLILATIIYYFYL
ncbi:MAG: vitamin K epoxide reductase family protein [Candidatus Babeliales bacterium]|nr:vitamin K epoxide reductase family protein [Candidatus Babeliales bacterium]